MDGQKLTRTNSSLLRSSPTIRSLIHSLSSVSEIVSDHDDVEEQKPHGKPVPPPVRYAPSLFAPAIAAVFFSVYAVFSFFHRDNTPASENLLLVLIFIAILLFLISRNILSLNSMCKQMCNLPARKLGFMYRTQSEPVQWFIGDSDSDKVEKRQLLKRANSVNKITDQEGEGVEFYSNGDFYEGEFHKGKCNGSGVYNYFVNGRYEGDWIDGRYDGYGIESWARGSKYRGQYKQGLRHGFGVYKFYTGDCYAGEWCNGQSHGVGVQTCGDGSCFLGEFKCGVKHGLGCYHFRNGDRYTGEYFGDKIHGFGIYHFANGQYYEGSWHEGCKQGYGMYTFRSGQKICGEWDKGNLKTHLTPPTDAVLQAVQAARKTADNAIHLRLVEEQVSRAVAAANRAATAGRVGAVKAVQNRIDEKICEMNRT